VRRLLVAVGLLALLAGALALVAWRLDQRLSEPLAFGAPGEPRTVVVEPGEPSRAILAQFEREGLLESAFVARVYLSRVLGDPPLYAGEYRFVSPVSAREVLRVLRAGEVVTWPVTVIEGLTLLETAEVLASAGFGRREDFVAEFSDPARAADLDPDATSLEGFLYPDTYRFPRGVPVATVTDALVDGFRRAWNERVVPAIAVDEQRSLRDLLILASLVEKEAARDDERALIAAVYTNRLRRGIGLYADPTVIYGLKLDGTWDGNLRRRDLEADSPWNTYKRRGLPPGPICSPGAASLLAAARPAAVDHLYFVSRNDGSHVFSSSLAEHNRNVEIWQRRFFRSRRGVAEGPKAQTPESLAD
jgi:UPF0755 protein